MKCSNALMVSDSGGVNDLRKAQEPVREEECGRAENSVLHGEFMVTSDFFEGRRVFHVCPEGGDVQPDFPGALRHGFHAANILSPKVLGIEHLHHVVVTRIAALPRRGHSTPQGIQSPADVVVPLFPCLPLRSILGVGLLQGKTAVVDR